MKQDIIPLFHSLASDEQVRERGREEEREGGSDGRKGWQGGVCEGQRGEGQRGEKEEWKEEPVALEPTSLYGQQY